MMRRCVAAVLALLIVLPASAFGQVSKAGIVTTLEGNVSARRATVASPVALKFKDDVFLQDTITTGDQSLARMLLGGKAVVTVRERSVLTITEVPGRSSIDLASGKFALAVAREKMRPGEEIQIRTPNAVAGVRGTVVITEVNRTTAQAGGSPPGVVTNFYVLRGSITAALLNQPGGTSTVGPLTSARFAGGAPPVLTPIPPEQISQITSGLQPSGKATGGVGQEDIKTQAVQTATNLLTLLTGGPEAFLAASAVALPTTVTDVQTPTLAPVTPLTEVSPTVIAELSSAIAPCTGCVRVTGTSITHSGSAFQSFSGSFVSASPLELLGFETSTVHHNGSASFIDVLSGADVTLGGSLATLVDSDIDTTGTFLAVTDSQLTTTGTAPLVSLDPSFITADGLFFAVNGSTLTLHGPLLAAVGGAVSSGANQDFFQMISSTLTMLGTDPLIRLTGTTATAGFHFIALVGSSMSLGTAPLLAVEGGQLTALNNILFAGTSSVTSGASAALISLTNGAVVEATNFDAAGVISGSTLTLTAGPLLSVDNSQLTARDLLFLQGTVTSGGPGALIGLTNGAVVNASIDVATVIAGSTMSLVAGPLLALSASQLTAGNDVLSVDGATVTSTNPEDLVRVLGGSTLTVGRDVVHVSGGSVAALAGGVAELVGGTLASRDVVHVVNQSVMTASEVFSADASTVSLGRDLVHVTDGGRFIVNGELMELENNNSVTIGGRFARATFRDPSDPLSAAGLVLVTGPVFEAVGTGNTVTFGAGTATNTIFGVPVRQTNGGFVSLGPGVGFVGSGSVAFEADGPGSLVTINPLLLSPGPHVTLGSQVLGSNGLVFFDAEGPSAPTSHLFLISAVEDPTQPGTGRGQGIAQLVGPAIRISNAVLNGASGGPNLIEVQNTTLALGGSLLEVINSTLDNSSDFGDLLTIESHSMVKTFGTAPLIAASGSTVAIGGSFVRINGSTLTDAVLSLSGPLLVADGSSVSASDAPFISINLNGTLVSTTSQPLVQLTNSSLTTQFGGSFLEIAPAIGTFGQVILAGPLLQATNSNVTIEGSLVSAFFDGTLLSTSTAPLVSLSGGSHGFGTGFGAFGVFDIVGASLTSVTDTDSGLTLSVGSDQPLRHGGVLFEASGATITSGTGSSFTPFVSVDSALLAASAPLINLQAGSSLTRAGGDLIALVGNARLNAILPGDALVKLDASTLTIANGSLINVQNGSFANIVGNLVSLTNATLNIPAGALISIADSDTAGASLFKLAGGSLIVASGASAVNLGLPSTHVIGGIGVKLTNGADPSQVQVNNGFVPFAGITVPTSVAVIAIDGSNGTSSKVILRP